MDSRWIGRLEGAAKEDRRKEVLSYQKAFTELEALLKTHFVKKEADRDYGTAGWEYRQIAVNEYNKALEDLLKLIDIDNK